MLAPQQENRQPAAGPAPAPKPAPKPRPALTPAEKHTKTEAKVVEADVCNKIMQHVDEHGNVDTPAVKLEALKFQETGTELKGEIKALKKKLAKKIHELEIHRFGCCQGETRAYERISGRVEKSLALSEQDARHSEAIASQEETIRRLRDDENKRLRAVSDERRAEACRRNKELMDEAAAHRLLMAELALEPHMTAVP